MDSQRVSQGQMVAGVAGIVLFIALFLKWLGADGDGGLSLSGWKSLQTLDFYLFILAVFAVLPALSEMSGAAMEVPFVDAAAAFLLSLLGLIQEIVLLIDPGEGVSVKIGFWLGLIATIAIVYGSYQAMNDDVSRR